MANQSIRRSFSRRGFLKLAGGAAFLAAGAAGLGLAPGGLKRVLALVRVAEAANGDPPPDLYFAGTDGWIYLPPSPAIPPFHPDDLAPAPFTTYIFGFRNITGLNKNQLSNQKMKAQHNTPLFWVNQYDPSVIDPLTNKAKEFRLQLTNLGLAVRPDLTDSHTVHWHGFRNVIPFYDGEPTTSLSVPVGSNFTYVYRPREPGSYMYHWHVEDVEHVHMGMTSLVFVRPIQNMYGAQGGAIPIARLGGNPDTTAPMGYAYNANDGTTTYDREFALFISEVWAEAHWADSHIPLPDWSDYHVDFALLNGRMYPDTLAPNSPVSVPSISSIDVQRDNQGDLVVPPAQYENLQCQPLSSLVSCNAGERVLLRFAHLGFQGRLHEPRRHQDARDRAGRHPDARAQRGRNARQRRAGPRVHAGGRHQL